MVPQLSTASGSGLGPGTMIFVLEVVHREARIRPWARGIHVNKVLSSYYYAVPIRQLDLLFGYKCHRCSDLGPGTMIFAWEVVHHEARIRPWARGIHVSKVLSSYYYVVPIKQLDLPFR